MERYYRIGEVARLLGEQPHTLRYWERQFRQPCPRRDAMGGRLYSKEDIALLQRIQHMLRVERQTMAQAKESLGAAEKLSPAALSPVTLEMLRMVLELVLLLLQPQGTAAEG